MVLTAPAPVPAVGSPPPDATGGAGHWLHAYRRMVVWDVVDLRLQLPLLASVLVLQGAGFALGIGLFFHHIPTRVAMFVVTGVPVVNLVTAGLIFEPQVVADQRTQGSYEFLQAMPVPRSATAAAWYTVSLVTALPAVVLSLVVGAARYHLTMAVTPAIVPAVLATSVAGTLIGYAIAHGVTAPMATRLVSVSFIFMIFGFCPVMFPAGQLPHWLVEVNRFLPFGSMATIVRAALVKGAATGVGSAYLVVTSWAAVSGLVAAWAVGRRS